MEQQQARELVQADRSVWDRGAGFAWIHNDHDIDAALFPAVLPWATLILLTRPFPNHPERWDASFASDPQPTGLTLFDLQDPNPDLTFGGRWNASSNKYGHGGALPGTPVPPEHYAVDLKARLVRALAG